MEASGTIQVNEIHGIFEVVIKFIEFIYVSHFWMADMSVLDPKLSKIHMSEKGNRIRTDRISKMYKLKSIFLIFFGPNTLNFPYISEELTDKYHLRKSILACIKM
jgi:hypothetical protein